MTVRVGVIEHKSTVLRTQYSVNASWFLFVFSFCFLSFSFNFIFMNAAWAHQFTAFKRSDHAVQAPPHSSFPYFTSLVGENGLVSCRMRRIENPHLLYCFVSLPIFLENGKCSLASSDVGMAGSLMLLNSEVFLFYFLQTSLYRQCHT